MLPFLRIATIWSDTNVHEIRITVCDGTSTFVSTAYVDPNWLSDAAASLERFGREMHGGLCTLDAGATGPEFANGAFSAVFHWYRPNALYIRTHQESDHFVFKGRTVTSDARLFLQTEPALLDRFVADLRNASGQEYPEATLECVFLNAGSGA